MPKKHSKPKRHNSAKSSSALNKRTPPSVPKSVKSSPEHGGYITDYVNTHGVSTQFLFKKTSDGYDVYLRRSTSIKWTCIKSDISFSPSTRSHFRTQPTLSKAIAVAEEWIEAKLPDIR